MDRSLDDAAIDEAAEDAPLLPLAGAVLGLIHVAAGVLALLAPLVTSTSVPPGGAALVVIIGVVLFVGSMVLWSPSVWS